MFDFLYEHENLYLLLKRFIKFLKNKSSLEEAISHASRRQKAVDTNC